MHEHNNNNKDGGHKGMMWMIIPCLILLGVLFLGGSNLSSGGYFLPILIGVFVVAHVWMMFKGHGGYGDANMEDKTGDSSAQESKTKNENSKHNHGRCCH